ncbi:LYR motif-containing protein 1 isoform X2 [Saccopteryx leptura]|uniref:LYR motif-containing protein 1 isoform X2 n=1 Tax=Saccopteryx leptura TaxID=249018 RepID=UPI00339BA410
MKLAIAWGPRRKVGSSGRSQREAGDDARPGDRSPTEVRPVWMGGPSCPSSVGRDSARLPGAASSPQPAGTDVEVRMSTATRGEVLGLYRRIFRLARGWQAASGQAADTVREKQYILTEARTLFQKNKHLTDAELIKQCISECTARMEIGLHYQNPYPRPIHLPPMGLAAPRGRGLRGQEKLRRLSKPVYLKSHDEVS